MNVQEHAAAAAAVIRKHDWIKGSYASIDGDCQIRGVCTLGALNVAAGREYDIDTVTHAGPVLMAIVEKIAIDPNEDFLPDDAGVIVAHWNDEDERTKEEVLAILDNLAAG